MADPLSFTAGIIAVIGAADGIVKTLAKVRSMKNAPDELLALTNEVSDLRIILGDIDNYFSQSTNRAQTPQEQLEHMSVLINRAKERILELDQLIQYKLVKPESVSDQIKVSRQQWARAKDVIEKFRQSLRDMRLNLMAQMLTINSNPTRVETIRSLFPDNGNYLEERGFSKLHKIVLGITSHRLEEELSICGASIDACDAEGNTPLIWAVRRNDTIAIRLLLSAGADPNICNKRGSSALIYAAQILDPAYVKLLLRAEADPRQTNNDGCNALHFAAYHQDNREMIEVLVCACISPNWRNNWSTTPLSMSAKHNFVISAEALIDLGADINSRDDEGDTALHNAVHFCADDVTQLLLARGATYTSWSSDGFSIIHKAALVGGLRTLEILQQASFKEIDPDAISRQGSTPLQLAVQREEKPEGFVEKLQELLTDIRARNAELERSRRDQGDEVLPGNMRPYAPFKWIRLALNSFRNWILETRWTQDLRDKLRHIVSESTWMTLCVYWMLGLGWAGFIYLMLERTRFGGSPQPI
ncbi:MAG: hypothetical protein Q9187_006351 [Circinaria calcarea]